MTTTHLSPLGLALLAVGALHVLAVLAVAWQEHRRTRRDAARLDGRLERIGE